MACSEITVLDALAARLADIQVADGYQTNLGLRIRDAEPEPEEAPSAPFLVVGGMESAALEESAASWTMSQELLIYVDGQERKYEEARDEALDALHDVERALRANPRFGGAILMQVRVSQKILPRRTAGSIYLIATAVIEIDYFDED